MALHTLNTKSKAEGGRQRGETRRTRSAFHPSSSFILHPSRGFTLAESLTASVILAIAVLGVCTAILAAQHQQETQEEDTTAIALGRQLMEEVSSRQLSALDSTAGWPTVTNKANYDSIGDFNGYSDTVSIPIRRSSTLTDAGSFTSASPTVTVITGTPPTLTSQTYLRKITVSYPNTLFGSAVNAGDFAIVSVTVTGFGGNGAKFSKIIANNTINR